MRVTPQVTIPDKKPSPLDPYFAAQYPNESLFQRFVERQFKTVMDGIAEPWSCYHTWRSTNSTGGFPDLVCGHKEAGVSVVAELKTETGFVRDNQKKWLATFAANPAVDTFLWFPSDIPEMMDYLQSVIEKIMQRRRE